MALHDAGIVGLKIAGSGPAFIAAPTTRLA
jgi:hypothetical protein